MKHSYRMPLVELLLLEEQDVIATSLQSTDEGYGDSVNFEDFIQ